MNTGAFTKVRLAADDPRRGAFLPIHNVRVVHGLAGWTDEEARRAFADGKDEVLYARLGARPGLD